MKNNNYLLLETNQDISKEILLTKYHVSDFDFLFLEKKKMKYFKIILCLIQSK